ncbi:MAG: hypothetical protein V4721_00365 [Bacteroidota bacterium]
MTFNDFRERVSTEDGLSKLDALIAQKIMGMKVEKRNDKFFRNEPPSEKYPKGGMFGIKQYTRSADALEDVLDRVASEGILVARYYNNLTWDGKPSKGPRYYVSVQWMNEAKDVAKIDQKGNSLSMNLITIAALLRWKGVLQDTESAQADPQ